MTGRGRGKGVAGRGRGKGVAGRGRGKGVANQGRGKGIANQGKGKGVAGQGRGKGFACQSRGNGVSGQGRGKGVAAGVTCVADRELSAILIDSQGHDEVTSASHDQDPTQQQRHLSLQHHTHLFDTETPEQQVQPNARDLRLCAAEIDTTHKTASDACTSSCSNTRKGRGKYKCIKVDMKTKGGTRLSVKIPNDIFRAVGDNARDLVNFCGLVVRKTAPLNVKSWQEAFAEAGDQMWRQIQERFEYNDDQLRLQDFVIQTMKRLYRGWKHKLHIHYKQYQTDEERMANPPADLPIEQWKYMIEHFGSAEFKKISMRNSANSRKREIKHTTGPVSFAEFEESLRDPVTGTLPDADVIWLRKHTRVTKEGDLQWADPRSKEVHGELKQLVARESQDRSTPVTQEDMLLQVFGPRWWYFRGKGVGKKGLTKSTFGSEDMQHQKITELEKELRDVHEKIEAERSEREAERTRMRNELRDEIQQELRDEMRHEMQHEMQQRFDLMFSTSLGAFLSGASSSQSKRGIGGG